MNDFILNIERNTETTWTFVFENEYERVRICASDFMNPLGSLFYSLRMILKNEKTKGIVSMIDEPEENIWVIKLLKNIVEIKIWNFEDYSGCTRDLTKGKKVFIGTMGFNRFLNQLLNSLYPFENQKQISELMNEFIELRKKSQQ